MGWKVFMGCAGDRPPEEVFRPGATHEPDAALEAATRLYPGRTPASGGLFTLDEALYPDDGRQYLGAFGHTVVLCDRNLADDGPLVGALAGLAAGGHTRVLVMHSVVDLCHFRAYEGDRLVREIAVTLDHGIEVDHGEPLPVEAPFWAGEHDDPDEGYGDIPFHPEEFGMALCKLMLGTAVDEPADDGFDPIELPMELFILSRPSRFARWRGSARRQG